MATIVRPDRYRDLQQTLAGSSPIIARGQGLSYCLASGADGGLTINMSEFRRITDFVAPLHNKSSATIEVEAGLPLGHLLEFLVANGYWFPVLPGYPSITIGGALAMNIHGKSQFHYGLFGEHVESLTLLHPIHGEIFCSRESNREVFDLTIGGFGLTGIITRVRLKISPLKGNSIERHRVAINSLDAAVELMRKSHGPGDTQFEQTYSWHDLNRRGAGFGSGFVYLERLTQDTLSQAPSHCVLRSPRLKADFVQPAWAVVARPSLQRYLNSAYRIKEMLSPAKRRFDLLQGSFPFLGNEIYFHLAGTRGFHEMQITVPLSAWQRFNAGLERLLSDHKIVTTLGSLKLFRGEQSLLNFQKEGVSVAIDIPRQIGDLMFMAKVDKLMLDCDGIPNIAKDSRLSAQVISQAYPGYAEFKRRLVASDPSVRMQSMLRKRLDV